MSACLCTLLPPKALQAPKLEKDESTDQPSLWFQEQFYRCVSGGLRICHRSALDEPKDAHEDQDQTQYSASFSKEQSCTEAPCSANFRRNVLTRSRKQL